MRWRPIELDYILSLSNPLNIRVVGIITAWILIIAGVLWFSISNLPATSLTYANDSKEILRLFVINPPMLIGLIMLFWLGFEWAFIPVFLSMFVIGLFSELHFVWAILFGLSFVFGISIYAIVYQCITIRYDLRSLGSIIVFIITSFVASTASSLGAFIWSLSHHLSAQDTAALWNGWWSGSLLQSVVIIGPILFLCSPKVEELKQRWYSIPKRKEVSTRWVYSAITIVTGVIAVFIYSGDFLGKRQISEELAGVKNLSKEAIINSLESFGIITWVSIWIILCVGIGAVLLISSWNKELEKKVKEKTASLKSAKKEVKKSLKEKEILLQEIHHRVKNNLAVVTALLELQLLRSAEENTRHVLSDAIARVKSMGFVHETLYQTENFSTVNLHDYIERLCNSIKSAYKTKEQQIDLFVDAIGCNMEMEKAIPLGLILNELLVNTYKHAFIGRTNGNISVLLRVEEQNLILEVSDNGVGFSESNEEPKGEKSLGMTIIQTLVTQLRGTQKFTSSSQGTKFNLVIDLNYSQEK